VIVSVYGRLGVLRNCRADPPRRNNRGEEIRDLIFLEERFGSGNWRKRKGLATVRIEDGTCMKQRFTGTRPKASECDGQKSSGTSNNSMTGTTRFAICIHNGEYAGTLDLRKVYEIIEDPIAAKRNFVRVIDESGEDYLYPASWFVSVTVSQNIEQLLHELTLK